MNYFAVISFLWLEYHLICGQTSERVLPLLMPNVAPKSLSEDLYLCTALKTNPKESEYITEFKPNASDPSILHHILILGCETLPEGKAENDVWKCGTYLYPQNCGKGRLQNLHIWGKNAPTYKLPKGVGFKVGGNTKLNYLVLHIHYQHVNRVASTFYSIFS